MKAILRQVKVADDNDIAIEKMEVMPGSYLALIYFPPAVLQASAIGISAQPILRSHIFKRIIQKVMLEEAIKSLLGRRVTIWSVESAFI